MTKKNPQLGWGFFILSKNLCSYKHCRGEHCSSAENRRFSDYPQGNNGIFALRRQIFLQKNLRTTDGRPYNRFLTNFEPAACAAGSLCYTRYFPTTGSFDSSTEMAREMAKTTTDTTGTPMMGSQVKTWNSFLWSSSITRA